MQLLFLLHGQKPESVISTLTDEKNNLIENEFFKVKIDPSKGSIVSVIDKKSGQEMVDRSSEFGFGQYLYERFSKQNTKEYTDAYLKVNLSWGIPKFGRPKLDDTPYKRVSGGKAKVTWSSDAISAKVIMQFTKEAGNPHNYSLSLALV